MPLYPALHPGGAARFAGTSAGLSTADDWRSLFASYPAIVLVANSDSVDVEALRASLPTDALFVFFNSVHKVLDRPFDGNALLVARSDAGGANIVRRGEVGDVLGYFASDRFLGILSVRASSHEKLAIASDFGGVSTGQLDLAGYFADFYPPDHLPSTGFALAVWLCELELGQQIVLAGFSGRRSYRLKKLFDGHDWTFEQVVQRLLVRSSRLIIASSATPHAYATLAKRFPEMSAADISLAAAEILSERLESANKEIDRLIWVTKLNQSIQKFIRSLKPIGIFVRRKERRPASEKGE